MNKFLHLCVWSYYLSYDRKIYKLRWIKSLNHIIKEGEINFMFIDMILIIDWLIYYIIKKIIWFLLKNRFIRIHLYWDIYLTIINKFKRYILIIILYWQIFPDYLNSPVSIYHIPQLSFDYPECVIYFLNIPWLPYKR